MRFWILHLLSASIFLIAIGRPGRNLQSAIEEKSFNATRQILMHVAEARNDLLARQYSLVKGELNQAQDILDLAKSRSSSLKTNPSFIKTQASINYALYALELNRPEVAIVDLNCASDYLYVIGTIG
jgi:hypothetical protein